VNITGIIPSISDSINNQNVQFAFGIEVNLNDTPIIDKLWKYISYAKSAPEKINSSLAGNLSNSLTLEDKDDWFLSEVLIPTIGDYKNIFKYQSGSHGTQSILSKEALYILPEFWVNFQKQHEFNPIHDHGGVFSFVLFMKIPYDWREQHKLPFVSGSNTPSASNFEFVYTDIFGKIDTYPYKLDSSWEGTMLFFPSEMKHMVYPFYNCEEERVTISGNIKYNI
jgi:hypothetical protein